MQPSSLKDAQGFIILMDGFCLYGIRSGYSDPISLEINSVFKYCKRLYYCGKYTYAYLKHRWARVIVIQINLLGKAAADAQKNPSKEK